MQQEIFNIIKSLTGQTNLITIPRLFIQLLQDYHGAALLSQLIYWTGRTNNQEGWIYKSYKEWEEELGLTERQVRYAKNKLEKLGILETKLKKSNGTPTLHYKINIDVLVEELINMSKPHSNRQNCQINPYDFVKLTPTILSTPLTKTTTKTTTYINTPVNRGGLKNQKDNPLKEKEKNLNENITPIRQKSNNDKNKAQKKNEEKEGANNKGLRGEKSKDRGKIPDKEIEAIKKVAVRIYCKLYSIYTGTEFAGDYGKLYKLAEKFAKELIKVKKQKKWSTQSTIRAILLYILFYLEQGKGACDFLFGRFPENYLEIQQSKKEKNWKKQFYKKAVETLELYNTEDLEKQYKEETK